MSRSPLFVVALLLAGALSPSSTMAQPVAGSPSLAGAVQGAWLRTPVARALSHRRAEADAALRTARNWTPAPPTVGLSALSDRFNARTGRQEWEAEVATPLWLPGQRNAAQTSARARQALGEAQMAAQRWELAGQVRDAWWQLALARAGALASAQRLRSAEALQGDVERRWRAGDLARTDANAAQAETQSARIEWLDAERERDDADAAWRIQTGIALPEALPSETLAQAPADTNAHPSLVAAHAMVDAALARLRLTERSRRDAPELALRWVRDRDASGAPSVDRIGVQLRIALSSEPRSQAEDSAVRAELAEAETTLERLREEVLRDAQRAQRAFDVTEQSLVLGRTRAQLAADTLQLMQKSFSLGEADLPTLLRVRTDAIRADADLARLTLARAAAISKLNQSHGVMP